MRRVHRAPAIQALRGLLYYHLDRATNTVINVSTWQSVAEVKQMETLAPMLARSPKSLATSLAATPFSPPRHVHEDGCRKISSQGIGVYFDNMTTIAELQAEIE